MKFGELTIGQKFETRSYKMNKEEIMAFANQYDPQYMHIDEEKAKKSRFKGINASGLHTLNVTFKLWAEIGMLGDDVIAGKGINNLKLTNPVYPDDVLNVKIEVMKKKEKRCNGEITLLLETFKNKSDLVLTCEVFVLIAK